jgi:hypothetical protein
MLGMESDIDLDAAVLGADYFNLLCFATRLAFASTVLTVGEASDGTLDPTDVMMFMKNIGASTSACVQTKCPHSDITLNNSKTSNRVNPVEVLYDAFPMFMYFDPTLGAPLLEPLLRYQSSGYYTQQYAARDAGELYLSNQPALPH